MEISINELLRGKATRIKNNEYLPTEAYINPFLERLHNVTDDFRVQVQLPNQVTLDSDGKITTEDITYNRVWIQAVLPQELNFKNHKQVIGLVYGLDVRKPIYKIYTGGLNMACTNLCVFNPDDLEVKELESNSPINFKPINRMLEEVNSIAVTLKQMFDTPFDSSYRNTSEQLGNWIKRCMTEYEDNGFGKIKLASSIAESAYKLLYSNEKSPYYVGEKDTNMFNVYNAFTQCITDSLKKDIMNQFEKTMLLKKILTL